MKSPMRVLQVHADRSRATDQNPDDSKKLKAPITAPDAAGFARMLPHTVLRAPFHRRDLGPLRHLTADAEGLVAHFDGNLSLQLKGDVRSFAEALLAAVAATPRSP